MTPLETYLREKAYPYSGGKLLGRVSIKDAAQAAGMKPWQAVIAIGVMQHEGQLKRLEIGGADGQTAFYMVAA